MLQRKIAVFFPGVGYTADRALLYYARRIAAESGYETVSLAYHGLPEGIKGNPQKMGQAFMMAFDQTEKELGAVDFSNYGEVLFVSKSFGTAIAVAYGMQYRLPVRHILFTPLIQTFMPVERDALNAIAFHGTDDKWADFGTIFESCRDKNIPLYGIEGGNHSLETKDIFSDLQNLQRIMGIAAEFMTKG